MKVAEFKVEDFNGQSSKEKVHGAAFCCTELKPVLQDRIRTELEMGQTEKKNGEKEMKLRAD